VASLLLAFQPKSYMHYSSHHACWMRCLSHSRFDRSNYYYLCSFLQPPITSSLFGSNILSTCSSYNVRDQVSHPYRTAGRIIVLYNIIFAFLGSRREDKMFWTRIIHSLYRTRKFLFMNYPKLPTNFIPVGPFVYLNFSHIQTKADLVWMHRSLISSSSSINFKPPSTNTLMRTAEAT
jgi:hypothetical protein